MALAEVLGVPQTQISAPIVVSLLNPISVEVQVESYLNVADLYSYLWDRTSLAALNEEFISYAQTLGYDGSLNEVEVCTAAVYIYGMIILTVFFNGCRLYHRLRQR